MLSGVSMAENRGCRVLLQRAPRGTPSSILTLRLRRCFHYHKASRLQVSRTSPLDALHNIDLSSRHVRTIHGTPSFRYAMSNSPPPLISQDAIALVQSLLTLSDANIARGAEPLDHPHTSNAPFSDGLASAHRDTNTGTQPVDPFGGASAGDAGWRHP
ncbi:hypothetical protein CIB48_g524 [Xylaria polymorpha]|nr:hypothetical protein CIB48_g524 [Xylaria polymorpha]